MNAVYFRSISASAPALHRVRFLRGKAGAIFFLLAIAAVLNACAPTTEQRLATAYDAYGQTLLTAVDLHRGGVLEDDELMAIVEGAKPVRAGLDAVKAAVDADEGEEAAVLLERALILLGEWKERLIREHQNREEE